MSIDEISFLVDIAGKYGARKVKITGGEPLVRADILDILRSIGSKKHIEDLSVVTNGILLEKYAYGLKESGVNRINISLDTLNPETYWSLSNGLVVSVLNGISLAASLDFSLLKINMLLLQSINEDNLEEMMNFVISLSDSSPIHLQLIELVKTSTITDDFFNQYFIDLRKQVRPWLSARASSSYFRRKNMRECFVMPEGFVVELVTPTHNSAFCEHCSRLRVTADGYLKPCLMREDNLIDIIGPMRNAASRVDLEKLFAEAISLKTPYWLENIYNVSN
jgi:cyclic pyranopterin phosphate synthase